MTVTEPIRGKVARILNDRELVINRGSAHGVTVGMKFKVLGREGDPIKDPETGDVLGSVRRVNIVVNVVQANERFSVTRTFRTKRVNVGGTGRFGASFEDMFAPPKWESRPETLRRDESAGKPMSVGDSVVQEGDDVEQTEAIGDDYETVTVDVRQELEDGSTNETGTALDPS